MSLDGIAISNIVFELREKILNGRVDKIYQPEKDEIILSLRSQGVNRKLLMTANSSSPRIHFVTQGRDNPFTPPLFCMVLRKHLTGGKITDIIQPNFERIIVLEIESLNELGDMTAKKLIIEIMGKHSNIILTDEKFVILDSARRVPLDLSSVRQVLPGMVYSLPPDKGKLDPTLLEPDGFYNAVAGKNNLVLQKLIYQSYNGISPAVASEICERAGADASAYGGEIEAHVLENVFGAFMSLMESVNEKKYCPTIFFEPNGKPLDFSSVEMTIYKNKKSESFQSISELLESFYQTKDIVYRVGQKTADLRKLVQLNIDRRIRKKEMHERTLAEISDREKLAVIGEHITANIYSIKKGMTTFKTQNFYDPQGGEIVLELDPELSPSENAQKYFKKYNKQKRTWLALKEQMTQNESEINYLEGVLISLTSCTDEADIDEIRQELADEGFVKKRSVHKSRKIKKSKPLSYTSSDGFEIYVGKNNNQNDELTLRFATASDIWLHTKDIPGSHVIIKTNGAQPPDNTIMEAANLAAYYSKAKDGSNVPVDYTQKRFVKKPNGAKPGFVIYDRHNTIYITPEEPKN